MGKGWKKLSDFDDREDAIRNFMRKHPPEKDGFRYPVVTKKHSTYAIQGLIFVIIFSIIMGPIMIDGLLTGPWYGIVFDACGICLISIVILIMPFLLLASVNGRKASLIGFSDDTLRMHKVKYYHHRSLSNSIFASFRYGPFRSMWKPRDLIDIPYSKISGVKPVKLVTMQIEFDIEGKGIRIDPMMYENFGFYYDHYLRERFGFTFYDLEDMK